MSVRLPRPRTAAGKVAGLVGAGQQLLAPPVETPFRSLNARLQGPAGWQVTLFQELETLDARRERPGFATDDERG